MKRAIVKGLEQLCCWTHFITHHRPWLWWFSHCPFTNLSFWLDQRWDTGVWVEDEGG